MAPFKVRRAHALEIFAASVPPGQRGPQESTAPPARQTQKARKKWLSTRKKGHC